MLSIMWPSNPEYSDQVEPEIAELWLALCKASEITNFVIFYCSERQEVESVEGSLWALPEDLSVQVTALGTSRCYIDFGEKVILVGDTHIKIARMAIGDCLASSIYELWCAPEHAALLTEKFKITER